MAKLERRLRARGSELISYLDKGITDSGYSCELVDSSVGRFGGVTVWLYVYDKYYMRTGSRAALTLQVVSDGDYVNVTAISAGGGNGSVLRFSLGAETDFVDTVASLLDDYE